MNDAKVESIESHITAEQLKSGIKYAKVRKLTTRPCFGSRQTGIGEFSVGSININKPASDHRLLVLFRL